MLVRAKVGFAGAFSMYKGQIMECSNDAILQDLLSCDYVEEYVDSSTITSVEEVTVVPDNGEPKGGNKNESKRRNSK